MMDDDFDEDFDDDSAHSSSSPNDNRGSNGEGDGNGTADSNAKANLARRKEQLGFAPQKEVTYNKLLPYAGPEGQGLDEESNRWFSRIKANLARSVACGDIRPGFVTWVSRLTKQVF